MNCRSVARRMTVLSLSSVWPSSASMHLTQVSSHLLLPEVNLVSALFNAKAWTLAPEERATVTQGCVTDGCRGFRER